MPGGRAFRLALAGYALALSLLVLVTPVPPMQDAPAHLAVLHAVDRVEAGSPGWGEVFEARPLAGTYWGYYLFQRALQPLISPLGALKLYLIGTLVCWLLALHTLWGRDRQRRWLVLLATPVIFHNTFFMGFLTLLPVYPLSVLCWALLTREPEAPLGKGVIGLVVGIGLFLLFLHPLGALFGAAVGSLLVAAIMEGTLRRRAPRALPLLVPLLALPLPVLLMTSGARWGAYSQGAFGLVYGELGATVATVGTHLFPFGGWFGWVYMVCVLAALGYTALRLKLEASRTERVYAVAVYLLVGASLLIPWQVGEIQFINVRLIPFVGLCLLCGLPVSWLSGPRGPVVLGSAALVLYLGCALSFASFSAQVRSLRALPTPAVGRAPARLLPLMLSPTPRPALRGIRANRLLFSLLMVERDWVHPYLFEGAHLPLAYRSHPFCPPITNPQGLRPVHLQEFDLVIVCRDPEDPRAAADLERMRREGGLDDLELVGEEGWWSLYRNSR